WRTVERLGLLRLLLGLLEALARPVALPVLLLAQRSPSPLPSHSRKPAQMPPVSESTGLQLPRAGQIFFELQQRLAADKPHGTELGQPARPLPPAIAPGCFAAVALAPVEPAPVVAAALIARPSVAELPPFGAAKSVEFSE